LRHVNDLRVLGQLRGKTVAVKTIDANWKSDGEVHTKILDDFRNECAVMTKLLHPNVRLYVPVVSPFFSLILEPMAANTGVVVDGRLSGARARKADHGHRAHASRIRI
jgi:hypothetical protein